MTETSKFTPDYILSNLGYSPEVVEQVMKLSPYHQWGEIIGFANANYGQHQLMPVQVEILVEIHQELTQQPALMLDLDHWHLLYLMAAEKQAETLIKKTSG